MDIALATTSAVPQEGNASDLCLLLALGEGGRLL